MINSSIPTGQGGEADEPLVLPVWPNKVPEEYGSIGPERFRSPEEAPTGDAKWLTDVTLPTITVYRPDKEQNTGVALLVCPGGGYWNLAWDLEGEEVAAWLKSIGITGIVLKYRVPRRPGQPELLPAPGPLLDAQRALSLVRSKAQEWGIDPNRVGMVGFSAGGHLVLMTATHFDRRTYRPIDAIDAVSCRPDFVVAVYPGYFAVNATGAQTTSIRIPPKTPPVLLIHAGDDSIATSENSVVIYQALRRAGVSAELHLYATGEHGFGVRRSSKACSTWPDRCVAWLQDLGVLIRSSEP